MSFAEKFVSPTGAGAHDGSSAGNAWTLAELIAGYAAGDRPNMIAGTYANTTTSRTFGTAGTTTAPVWIRGYNTTIGDCDLDPTLARPEITFTTGGLTVSAAHHIWSSINTSAARNAAAVTISGAGFRGYRSRFINTAANSAANALMLSNTGSIEACYASADAAATRCVAMNGAGSRIFRTHIVGGISNVDGTSTIKLYRCLLRNAASDGILQATNGGVVEVHACTIRNTGRDGIRLGGAAATPAWSEIMDNIFAVIGGYGINNVAAAGNTNLVHRSGNRFYGVTSGEEAGFGDSPYFGQLTGGSDPHVSTTNLSLVLGDAARAEVFVYENFTTTVSYTDRGAVQHLDAVGGGGPTFGKAGNGPSLKGSVS